MSSEFTVQQKATIEAMMVKAVEKALAANSAKDLDKGKGGPGAVLKQVEKDQVTGEWKFVHVIMLAWLDTSDVSL